MNPRIVLLPALVAAGLLVTDAAHAFRCGNKIVRDGMHEVQVIAICGEPTSVRQLGSTLHGYDYGWQSGRGGLSYYRYPGWGSFATEVAVTEFVYNFGPRKLMRRLIFEGGVLVRIESIGYGYRED